MAGDWIPMQVDLHRRVEVVKIASRCRCSRYEVVGMLLKFWGWVTRESVDGRVDADVDAIVDATGLTKAFFRALVDSGWLAVTDGRAHVPNWDRWLSSGAKSRLQKNMRQSRWRKRGHENVDASVDAKASTTEQNRTEQENNVRTLPASVRPPDLRTEKLDWSGFNWHPVIEQCAKFVDTLGVRATTEEDRVLVVRVCALASRGVIEQAWLTDAVDSFRANRTKVRKPWAYFKETLAKIAADNGLDLRRTLKGVSVPKKGERCADR